MKNEFVLYSYFRSSTSYRTRIALNLKGLDYVQKTIHLLEDGGQQHKSEYLALNPAAEVPTLTHNGLTISQSFAIIEYLDELVAPPPLFGGSAYDRAKIRQICEQINCGIHPVANLKVQQYLTRELGVSEEQKTIWVQHWIRLGMEALEKLVQTTAGDFAYGHTLSAADVFIVPQIFSGLRFGVGLENYPTLQKINSKCLSIEAFKKAHPHLQPDTPLELRGKL